jgi:hypothetical protein
MSEQKTDNSKRSWIFYVVWTAITSIPAVVGGVAVFENNLLSIRDTFDKLFGLEPLKITVQQPAASQLTGSTSIEVSLVAHVEGASFTKPISCTADGYGDVNYSALPNVENLIYGVGDEWLTISLVQDNGANSSVPDKLNFELICSGQPSPIVPIDVAKTAPQLQPQQKPTPSPDPTSETAKANCANAIQSLTMSLRAQPVNSDQDLAGREKTFGYPAMCNPPSCSVCGSACFGNDGYRQTFLTIQLGTISRYLATKGCPPGQAHSGTSYDGPCEVYKLVPAPVPVRCTVAPPK